MSTSYQITKGTKHSYSLVKTVSSIASFGWNGLGSTVFGAAWIYSTSWESLALTIECNSPNVWF